MLPSVFAFVARARPHPSTHTCTNGHTHPQLREPHVASELAASACAVRERVLLSRVTSSLSRPRGRAPRRPDPLAVPCMPAPGASRFDRRAPPLPLAARALDEGAAGTTRACWLPLSARCSLEVIEVDLILVLGGGWRLGVCRALRAVVEQQRRARCGDGDGHRVESASRAEAVGVAREARGHLQFQASASGGDQWSRPDGCSAAASSLASAALPNR